MMRASDAAADARRVADKELENLDRQHRHEIDRKIRQAVKDGKFSVVFKGLGERLVGQKLWDELVALGYRLETDSYRGDWGDDLKQLTISWGPL